MKTVTLDGIGEVQLKKSARAKRLILKISSEGVPVVTVPTYVPYIVAQKFAIKQRDWIQTHATPRLLSVITEGKKVGSDHIVAFTRAHTDKVSSRVGKETIVVHVPAGKLRTHPTVQAEAKKACIRALRKQAEVHLPKRIHELSEQFGHRYNNITVRAVKTRWGSCSSQGNINLSIWLMQLPEPLVDYVLCHELAHLEHQHHQPAFWNEVAQMIPDFKARRKALKDYQPRLM